MGLATWIPVIVQIFVLVGTIVTGLFILQKTSAEARKTIAEAKSIEDSAPTRAAAGIVDTSEKLVNMLQEQVEKQAIKIAQLEKETAEQESKIELLTEQVGQFREVNASLLEKNAELQRKVKICEDGKQAQ